MAASQKHYREGKTIRNHVVSGILLGGLSLASVPSFADNPGATKNMPAPAEVSGSAIGGTQVKQLDFIDKDFVLKAGEAGVAEHQMAGLAAEKATSSAVKKLAGKMGSEHANMNTQLGEIISTDNVQLPHDMSSEDQATYDKLNNIDKADFDKAYLDQQKQAHEDAISLFKKEASEGKDIQLKSWAKKSVAALKHHKMMIANAEATLK